MEITTTTINRDPSRRAAVNALAVVGFIVLLLIGIGLAIYSARFVPQLASRMGGAAVSLSSIFKGNDENPTLDVVSSTATTTLPIDGEVIVSTTTEATTGTTPARTNGGSGSTGTYTVVTTTQSPIEPYGQADLTVSITDTGYLRTSDISSFVKANEIPDDKRGAVRFTVTNTGTNVTGSWKFKAEIPTSPAYTFTSPTQRSLKPGDRIDFTLGFTKPRAGDNREITITVDTGKDVRESNESNNEDSARVDIER